MKKTDLDSIVAKVIEALSTSTTSAQRTLETSRARIVLTGDKQYQIESNSDGLIFSSGTDTALVVGRNGQLATGTRPPKTVGKGSAH